VREAGEKLARACEDIGAQEKRSADVKAELKAREAEIQAEVTRLTAVVRRQEEYRDVAVNVMHDYARGRVYEVRLDTGEEIGTREMTNEERQLGLPGVPKPPLAMAADRGAKKPPKKPSWPRGTGKKR
jgi:hypothetical protein